MPPATDQQLARILMGSPMDIPMQLPLPSTRTAGRAVFQAGSTAHFKFGICREAETPDRLLSRSLLG
jgi:hypothetical protein